MTPPASSRDGDIDVGVVVVTHNSAGVIGMLLATLDDGLGDLESRVVFVDNASSDDTVAVIQHAGLDVIALDVNRGYAAAINRGIRHLPNSRAVLVLNPDVALFPGSVAAMVNVLDDEHVGVVAPKTYSPGERSNLGWTQRRDPSLLRVWGYALLGDRISRRFAALSVTVADPHCYEVARDVDWAVGAVLLCSRRCVDVVGDWDESYFLYSEEIDYCRRARDAGFAVRYTPDAVVTHEGGGDGAANPRLRAMRIVNAVREYRRRHGAIASWCFYAGVLFHELCRVLAGRGTSRTAAVALLSPRRRPWEINASNSLLPGSGEGQLDRRSDHPTAGRRAT
jgi:N-acetylglucosaminyl-diphospho-decaprenol L-rhamnosyltransferase